MGIPDKIQIIGCEIKTSYEEKLLEELGLMAQANTNFNEIRIRKKCEGKELGEGELFENYIHELTHFMINKIGYKELAKNEEFIEVLSNVLVQVIKQLKK